jgi:hypothetical protein
MTKKEMVKLQPGNIIRHKKDLQWAFLVSQNFGDRLTAVRTIELKEEDLKNWEVIEGPKVEEVASPQATA